MIGVRAQTLPKTLWISKNIPSHPRIYLNIQFFIENMKRKWDKKNLTCTNRDLNLGFLNKFPPKILILREIRSIQLMVLKKTTLTELILNTFNPKLKGSSALPPFASYSRRPCKGGWGGGGVLPHHYDTPEF